MTHEELGKHYENKIRKFKDSGYPISMASDAKAVMDILFAAKLRCENDDIEQRYEVAIASIGMHYLEAVEKSYEPVKKTYRVHIKGERYVDVEAESEDDAEQIVNNSSNLCDHERTTEVEEAPNEEN